LDKKEPVVYSNGGPLDADVRTTMKNLQDQESVNGVWELPPKDYLGLQIHASNVNQKELQREGLESN